jgi:Zn-dependent M28 family amino/carboxypeptidase
MNVTNLYVPTLPVLPSNSCCSDYLPYYEAGYPSIGFFENDLTASANPNYHKTTDTIETIYPEQIALDARAVGAAVMLAARPYGIFNRN